MRKIKMKNNKIKNIGEGFERFQKFNESKNLSEKTIEYYKESYEIFRKYLSLNDIFNFNDLNREFIEDYTIYLQEKDLSPNSINTYLRGIRAFLYYMMSNGWMTSFKINTIKTNRNKPKGYNEKQLKKLLIRPDMNKCTFAYYRNWVIINFFLDTGIRASSLTYIKIKDLNLEMQEVEIRHTKSRRERTLPLSETMTEILYDYLEIRNGELPDYLFPNVYGERLTRSGLTHAIRSFNKSRDVDKTSIHGFRHSYSKIFIKNGGTISQLRKILGHKNIETTDKYINLLISDFKDDYSRLNPLESLIERKKSIKFN